MIILTIIISPISILIDYIFGVDSESYRTILQSFTYIGITISMLSFIILSYTIIIKKTNVAKFIAFAVNKNHAYKELSVIKIIASKRLSNLFKNLIIFTSGFLLYLVFQFTANGEIKLTYICGFLATISLFALNYGSFLFRVHLGYFGNNVEEAREIIKFIKLYNDEFTNGDGSGGKKIFEERRSAEENYITDGGIEHV